MSGQNRSVAETLLGLTETRMSFDTSFDAIKLADGRAHAAAEELFRKLIF